MHLYYICASVASGLLGKLRYLHPHKIFYITNLSSIYLIYKNDTKELCPRTHTHFRLILPGF